MPENVPKYDAWLHWLITAQCAMHCEYCLSRMVPNKEDRSIPPIDIARFMHTLEETGKIFRIQFSGGGEPFLVPNLIDACVELQKKHYLAFNMNFAEEGVADFIKRVNPHRVIELHTSCHIKALERRNLLMRYINNVSASLKKEFRTDCIEVAYPPLLPEVAKYRKLFADHGLELRFGEFIGPYKGKTYPQAYTQEELEAFGLTRQAVARHYPGCSQTVPFCNGGYNVVVGRSDGTVQLCSQIKERLGHVYEGITFKKHMVVCPFKSCGCPLRSYDSKLFERALKENRFFVWWNTHTYRQRQTLRKIFRGGGSKLKSRYVLATGKIKAVAKMVLPMPVQNVIRRLLGRKSS